MGCGSSFAAQQGSQTSESQEAMICDMCQSRLNFINRKKVCDECQNCFCKSCLPRESGNSRTCSRCKVLVRRPGERTELMKLRVKDLQNYLCRRKINIKSCVEKKDLVELVLQTNGGESTGGGGGVPSGGGGAHGPGGGAASADHQNNPRSNRVPPSNSWQDNTIRVSDQIPLERSGNFPQSYTESTHRREFFEKFSRNPEENVTGQHLDLETIEDSNQGQSSSSIPDLISPQNICEDKPPSVNPADKIIPFNQQDDDISDNDKPSSEVSPGVEATETTPVEVIESSETLVENIEEDESIGVDVGEANNDDDNDDERENERAQEENTRPRSGVQTTTLPRLLSNDDIIEVSVIPDTTSEPNLTTHQRISAEDETIDLTEDNTNDNSENKEGAENRSSQRSGATKKLKPDLLAETSTSLPCSPRRFANQGVVYLSEIQSVEDFKDLSGKQVKEILAMNRVNFKGCVEKEELLKIVERLWREERRNKDGLDEMQDDSICKICMDAAIDCVMLECGHMCTCTNCGKQMAECPICRQYVVRVVRTFKS